LSSNYNIFEKKFFFEIMETGTFIGIICFSCFLTLLYFVVLKIIYYYFFAQIKRKFTLESNKKKDLILDSRPISLLLKITHIYSLLLAFLFFLYLPKLTYLLIFFLICETISATFFKKGQELDNSLYH